MKKVLFLLFTCLLLMAFVIPACDGGGAGEFNIPANTPASNIIKIGVIGPMQFIQGQQQWMGAVMAAENINGAGGIVVGGNTYYVDLIKSDSNETLSITDAAAAMEKLIYVDDADYIIGGFRTEAVTPMQEIAMDNKKLFLGCGAATASLNSVVKQDYDRYKYWFRVTPFVSAYLIDNEVLHVAMAGAIIKEQTGIQRPLKVAVCSEGAQWADSATAMLKNWIPKKLGMEVVGVWRPSPNATDLNAEMTAIQAANTDIIAPVISGAVGVPYGRAIGELRVPVASVGINVECSGENYMKTTNNFGDWECVSASYSTNMEMTPLTKPFVEEFMQRSGQTPQYNAGTYDAIYILVDAIKRAGTLDTEALIPALEATNITTTVSPSFTFTGMDHPMGIPHDVAYGPGANTGIAIQWQNGEMLGVWPNGDYGYVAVDAGYPEAWKDLYVPGTVKWKVPPLLLEKLQAETGVQPAAPATPATTEEPAAPPATTEEPAAPPAAAAELPFEATTYCNDEFGFCIQYPSDWVENPSIITVPEIHKAAFSVEGFVPGVACMVFDKPEATTKEWLVSSFKATGSTMPKVTSDITEITLSDGSPAYAFTAGYVSSTGYEVKAYCVDASKGDKQIRINCYTVDTFEPYNEEVQSAVAKSLTLK